MLPDSRETFKSEFFRTAQEFNPKETNHSGFQRFEDLLSRRRNRDSVSKSRQIVRNDQGMSAFRKSCFAQHRSVEQIKLT